MQNNSDTCQNSQHIKAAIFDWAGTVLDFGCIAPVAAFQTAFENVGVPITEAEAREPMGTAKRVHIEQILEQVAVQDRWVAKHGKASDQNDVDAIYADFLRIDEVNCAVYSDMIPGALDAIQALRERGIKIGSTTGYPRSIMNGLMPLAAAQGYVPDCCVTVSEVENGRPYPDMILENTRAFGIEDTNLCIVVDDSPSGLVAGRAAEMWTVGIAASGNEVGLSHAQWSALSAEAQQELREKASKTLFAAGAHYVIDTIADLMPVLAQIEARIQAGEQA